MTFIFISLSTSKDFSTKVIISIFLFLFIIPNKTLLFHQTNFFFYLNEMSYLLGLLIFIFIHIIIIIETHKEKLILFNVYIITVLFLKIITFLSFLVSKIFHFFILFELSLIPIFILIIGWGYQPERKYARILIIFYTISASLPFIIIILIIKHKRINFFF